MHPSVSKWALSRWMCHLEFRHSAKRNMPSKLATLAFDVTRLANDNVVATDHFKT